jgi:hypothetical protein
VSLGDQKKTNINLKANKTVINRDEDENEDSSLSLTQQSLLSLSKEKEISNTKTKQRGKKNCQGRANELLEDTFLACLDRSKSTSNGETIAASAIEDPESFMKSHFPVVYKHAKKGQANKIHHWMTESEFKSSSKNFCIYPNEIEMAEKKVCKKIWGENKNDCECIFFFIYKLVTDFLFKVEQIWPANLIPFSIEFCLEYLMLNKYNYHKVTNLVKYKDPTLRNFIHGKKIEAAEIEKLAAQNKKSYQ